MAEDETSATDSLETVDAALSLARSPLAEVPGFSVYQSIATQLDYVAGVLGGTETGRGRLKDVMVGFYGVREFEDSDRGTVWKAAAIQWNGSEDPIWSDPALRMKVRVR